MSTQVNVLAIHALDELRGALVRFSGEAGASLQAASQEAQRTLDWLAERQAYWQREVRRRQEILQAAHAALRDCQSQVYYDRDGRPRRPDCGGYQAQVSQARAWLAEGEADLQTVVRCVREVQQAVADYRREAQRLAGFLARDLAKSTALLTGATMDLHRYLATAGPSGAAGPLSSQRLGPSAGAGGGSGVAALDGALDHLAAAAAGGAIAGAIRAAGTTVRFGSTGEDAIAYYDTNANEIVLHASLQDASPAILAAHLAHEGTHVQWRHRAYSLDEEYHAFRNQTAVWRELKGDESDAQCDWVSGIIALGETRAKWQIAALYPDLPEYG